ARPRLDRVRPVARHCQRHHRVLLRMRPLRPASRLLAAGALGAALACATQPAWTQKADSAAQQKAEAAPQKPQATPKPRAKAVPKRKSKPTPKPRPQS